jgi:hypothetical protein
MTEDHPHIVYAEGRTSGLVTMFPNYKLAHEFWRLKHDFKTPYLIATVGRKIQPSTPVIDVNE